MYWVCLLARNIFEVREFLCTVLEMHLHSRSIRCFANPYVQILAFPGLEENHVVAIVEFSQLIELVKLRLCIKLCVFAAVR